MAGLPLRTAALDHLDPRVGVPGYDRSALTPAVVHLGVGCFHRAHQAAYFDRLAEQTGATPWGIVGVGLRSPQMHRVLRAQQGLYTLLERGPMRDRVRVIGALARSIFAPARPEAVLDALADRRTRMVTLTVTAAGYRLEDPEVLADLRRPRRPTTALGYLVEGLDRRRRAGAAGFTVVSCDNLPGNGAVVRDAVLAVARLRDSDLAAWIEDRVAFPSTMVDRITPRTAPADRERLEQEYGIRDRWPVVAEPFAQWIVEDRFCNERPPLDEVGVQLVRDVRPYALVKTRMLNGAHVALGHIGMLAGLHQAHEAMADPLLADYADGLLHEVAPLLPRIPGVDVDRYRETLLTRIANPRIGDQLTRLGRNGSSKVPAHLLASVREALAQDRPCELLLHGVAAWMRLLRGADDAGRPATVEDPLLEQLQPLARSGGSDPRPLLSVRSVFGDLVDDLGFVAALAWAIESQDRQGVRQALAEALQDARMAA